jgi:hypothetical protein
MAAEGPTIGVYLPLAVMIGDAENTTANTTQDRETLKTGGGAQIMFNWNDSLDNGMTLNAFMSLSIFDFDQAGGVSSRNSYLGLAGDFGSIKLGANEHFFETDAIFDGYAADWARLVSNTDADLDGGSGLGYQVIGRTGHSFVRRDTNSIWWTSNDINGLTVKAAHIFSSDATADNAADESGYQLGVNYAIGGLSIKANIAKYDDIGAPNATITGSLAATAAEAGDELEGTEFIFGYDFGAFKTTFMLIDMSHTDASAGTTTEANGYAANVTMPVATGRLLLNYGDLGDQDQAGVAVQDSGKSGFDIGYQHDMSANTYTFVRYTSTEQGANFTAAGTAQEVDAMMAGIVFSY